MKRYILITVTAFFCCLLLACGGELGTCSIYCSGVSAGGSPWSTNLGPFEDYTEDECTSEAKSSCGPGGGTCSCSGSWEAY